MKVNASHINTKPALIVFLVLFFFLVMSILPPHYKIVFGILVFSSMLIVEFYTIETRGVASRG